MNFIGLTMNLITFFKRQLPTAHTLSRSVMFLFLVAALAGGAGCKSQKKAAAEAAERERALLEERKAEARSILLDIMEKDNLSVEEKERLLQEVKDMNLDDAEIDRMIARAEEHIANERRLAEERNSSGGMVTREAQLEQQFMAIANAPSTSAANQTINEVLNQFSSPEALVLIIIYKDADNTDYDEPTNITKYLNYLKDQKKMPHSVDKVIMDNNGRIKELELLKK